jgi:polysaccharide export outer membrane protein
MAQVLGAKRTVEELGRQIDKTDEALRIESLKELQEGSIALEKTRVRMQTVAEKLTYVGAASNATAFKRDAIQAVIHRRQGEQTTQIDADAETNLEPGDVLEITLKRSQMPGLVTESRSN